MNDPLTSYSGGTFSKDGMYFSESMPENVVDRRPFDSKAWKILDSASSPRRTPEIIAMARDFLVRSGYLDRNDLETEYNPRMHGAITRYKMNFEEHTMGLRNVLLDQWIEEDRVALPESDDLDGARILNKIGK